MLPRFHFSVERWKKNQDYGVWVSNQGRVRLIKNKKDLDTRIDQDGYCVVFTQRGICRVHKLVALTWLGEKPDKHYNIDHISTNKRDNSVKNLRWIEQELNTKYGDFNRVINVETQVPTKVIQSIVKNIETATVTTPETKPNKEDKQILNPLYNTNTTITKRTNMLREYILNGKITVLCNGQEMKTFKDIYKVKATYAQKASNDDFLNKIIMGAKSEKEYCGCTWQLRVNNG